MVAESVKLIIWGLCPFSSPPFSLSSPNSFHSICMYIIVSSQELAVQLWRDSNVVCLSEEMLRLCVCSNEIAATHHIIAVAAYNEVDLSHPSVFHGESCISIILFSKRKQRQLKSSQGLPGFLLLIYILNNESIL